MIMAAAEFKAKCLSLLDRVHHRGESITITKRGRVVARLVPAAPVQGRPLGTEKGRVFIADDFDAPLPKDLLKAFEK